MHQGRGLSFPPLLFKRGSTKCGTRFSFFAFLLLGIGAALAQVSSHAPTVFTNTPAQSAAKPAQSTGTNKPVARVNSAVLTDADLVREEYAIFPYARQHNGIPKEFEKQIRDGALKMIVFEELVYQEALREKLTVSAVKLQHAEAEFPQTVRDAGRIQRVSAERFQRSHQLLQEKIQRSLLIEAYLKTRSRRTNARSQPRKPGPTTTRIRRAFITRRHSHFRPFPSCLPRTQPPRS